MEAVISVIVGELATRSLSFLIDRYFKPATSKEDTIQKLQWMLLRVRLTVEEAEGRCITNQTMLRQLSILRTVMYRGYYLLDTVIQQVPDEEKDKTDHGLGRFLSLSKFSPAKRVCFSAANKYDAEQLKEMLENLEITITGMTEFVIFLRNYPPMCRQAYSTYLFMEKCMFCRQLEMEQVIIFLLHEEPPVHCNVGVLPIVGPGKVGKTTLVEHVCCDERVRDHFSHIIFLSDNDFREGKQFKLRERSRIKHQPGDSNEEKFLVVVELVGNIDESTWRMLHSASESSIPKGSKVIITSRSDNILNFGTTQALKLNFLSREAYWYYFRTLVFGSTDPEEHPKLASLAMAIIDEYFDRNIHKAFTGPFIYLNNVANILKGSVGVQAWRQSLECLRENWKQNGLMSSASLSHLGTINDRIFLRRETKAIEYCVVHNQEHRIVLDNEEAPKINLLEIISGSVPPPQGKFEVLVWKSHLVPYQNHIYKCEILELECKVSRNRQVHKRKVFS
ncbi:unnamed protein product [Urochloa decumbens]|uniref:NB-ARC domain-containing protein n=1 Tax=Urochloa decumbens TaxID=240449 RepID=A0ABC9GEX8_9POAL